MRDSNVVSLEVASPVDAEALSELLEHYVGELSTLFAIEAEARESKRGLWRDPQAVPPWEWRRESHRQ